MKKHKVLLVGGIRPDWIRYSEIIRLLDKEDSIELIICHTGQHYDRALDSIFFEQLQIREPDLNLEIGKDSKSLGEQLAKLFIGFEKALDQIIPDLVMFLGDTNSVLASIISTRKNIKTARIEGAMRSFNRAMPEEKNRIVCDHLADILYVYLPQYADNAILEGIPRDRVTICGNTIVDVINKWKPYTDTLDVSHITGIDKCIFATLHREENIESEETLHSIIRGMRKIAKEESIKILLTQMPRFKKSIEKFDVDTTGLTLIEPVGFFESIALQSKAEMVFTDSGSIQEEATIIGTKHLCIRTSTERPECMECGAGILSGTNRHDIYNSYLRLKNMPDTWDKTVLGDGHSAEIIVKDLIKRLNQPKIYKPWEDSRKSRAWFTL